MKNIPLRDRIILALDVPDPETAKKLVLATESKLGFYKVGLQLFMADWFHTVDWIVDRGHKVMVDLKFFDIPETVHLAVKQLMARRVSLATVHGNDAIVKAAMDATRDKNADESLKILAVTVLTSFGEDDLRAMGMTQSIEDLVYFRAKRALDLGCDGVVSSGLEAERLRKQLGEKLLIVTPGIRPGANIAENDDQKRVMSAGQAIAAGADYVVVGRPISKAEDPDQVITTLQEEIQQVVESHS
ncbi:MAG: orotidine-5'-phosphate decarboxylase [Proteobacteria bacterium]|nr:orotidine-5'-phosphate decarboxylase [Desulfobulbaceae bacterium]MBU4152446.1 orotidine-5'-phosphate decarboxylase [Pseudomonadota bacterium]MDP2105593.1 orotidine-5'-phosphate decarboxylase [Desulfobulbaceae bacterium]